MEISILGLYWGLGFRVILGLYRHSGKEHGNYGGVVAITVLLGVPYILGAVL